jgi:hypothetical protein
MHHTPEPSSIGPQHLAQAYDAFIAARWRGDDACADAGTAWFEAHWSGQAPPEPEDPPEAASVLGAAGHGIRWYARGGLVLGYAGGQASGCYRIAEDEALPAAALPWRSPLNDPPRDQVLNHAGADGMHTGAEPWRNDSRPAPQPRTLDEVLLGERVTDPKRTNGHGPR